VDQALAKWKKGQSGNPAGRPPGARDRLSEAVYKDMLEDWSENGLGVIQKVREKRPELYLQAVIRLVPTRYDMTVSDVDHRSVIEYSTAELLEIIEAGPKEVLVPVDRPEALADTDCVKEKYR